MAHCSLPLPCIMKNIVLYIANPGRDENSKFKVWLLQSMYCIHTIINSKNQKPKHCKLGTICRWLSLHRVGNTEVATCCDGVAEFPLPNYLESPN